MRYAKFGVALFKASMLDLGVRSSGRSRSRSAKFELILTTRCQYLGVDLPVDLPI